MSRAEGASRVIEAGARDACLIAPPTLLNCYDRPTSALQASSFVLPEVRTPSRHIMTEFAPTQPVDEQPAGYDPAGVERRWQSRGEDEATNEAGLGYSASALYALMMFPYPSAEGLLVGNLFAFTGSDIYG